MAGHTINISVLADTKKFSRSMQNLSRESGLSRLGTAFKNAGSRVVGFFKTGVKWTGALALALAGLALKGGFERALRIEDAEAKMRGLGHSTDAIETIMDSALASVKGTAAGLDEAATMAANAVAAGIKPGDDLTAALTLVNDAATIAGTSMGEMGSIFSKVWTSGRAQTQELNQIADRGIPIWTELAEHYGVSADELRKMVSQGKVDAETFETVMNDLLGGSALEAGNTTRGAFANMRAALSRLGESALKEVFPMFRDAFVGITGWLDAATDRVGPMAETFSHWLKNTAIPAVQGLWTWLGDNLMPVLRDLAGRVQRDVIPAVREFGGWIKGTAVPAIRDFVRWLIDNKDTLLIVVSAVAAFVAALKTFNYIKTVVTAVKAATIAFKGLSAAMIANPLGLIIAAIAALVAGLVYFFTQTETGRRIWETVWGAIKTAAQAVATWFTGTLLPILQGVWDGITAAAQTTAAWYTEHIAPIFAAFGELLSAVWDRIAQAATWLWEHLQAAWEVITAGWEILWTAVQAVWETIGPPIMEVIGTAFENLQTYLSLIWENIKAVIETVLGVIRGIITAVTKAIQGDWSGAWRAIQGIVTTIWNGIKRVISNTFNAVRNIISNTLGTVRSLWASGWSAVKNVLSNAWTSIKTSARNGMNNVVATVRGLPRRAREALSNIGSTLLNAGRNLIGGFIDGIRGGFDRVRDTLSGLTDMLPDWKGPARRDKNLLKDAGQLVIAGFVDGLESQYTTVKRSLRDLTGMVSGTDVGTLSGPRLAYAGTATPPISSAAGGSPRGLGGAPIINVYALTAGPEVGRQVHKALREYERSNGVRP